MSLGLVVVRRVEGSGVGRLLPVHVASKPLVDVPQVGLGIFAIRLGNGVEVVGVVAGEEPVKRNGVGCVVRVDTASDAFRLVPLVEDGGVVFLK